MTRDEVVMVMGIMKIAYPRFYTGMTRDEANKTIDLWHSMFENDNAKLVTEAVKAMITTLKFPPTIADIKEKIRLITKKEEMTELEAWNKVYSALRNSNYRSQEEFDNLPSTIKRLVGSSNQLREWAKMDGEIVKSVIQSNFMRSYKARVAENNEYTALPDSTKLMMGELRDKFKMLEG